jgi:transposase
MQPSIGTPLRLCHLPLIMDVLRRTGVLDVIDRAVVDDRRSKVSTSDCVAVMLCSIFGGAHDLWRVRERLGRYDMPTVMQDRGFSISEFPEERLAKALDDLWTAHVDKLMTAIALQAIEAYDLETGFLHFDTTSLSFYGAYEREDPGSLGDGIPAAPRVVHGYSKNRRGDLKQILYGSLLTADGGIPLAGRAMDGNRSDNEASAEFFADVRKLVVDPREVCCVADSKGWCARTLTVVQSHGMRLLSRLPRNTVLHREHIAKAWEPTGSFEEPPAKKGAPPTSVSYQGFDSEQTFTREVIADAPEGKSVTETFTIPVRLLKIRSSDLLRTKVATALRERSRERQRAMKLVTRAQAMSYACQPDADMAAERLRHDHGLTVVDLVIRVERHEGPFVRPRGRPPKHAPKPDAATAFHYRLAITVVDVDQAVITARLTDAATIILIRTANPNWAITDEEMITRYKGQWRNEHGFAWLKSGMHLNPVFLKTPARIGSLCFLYTIGLMVWNLIQRTVRKHLHDQLTGLPYHRGKPSANITTRFYLDLFAQVQTIPVTNPGQHEIRHLAGFTDTIQKASQALGTPRRAFEAP